jgi:hypothetical protein
MSAVVGETRYQSDTFANWNFVGDLLGGATDQNYCSGCNGTFTLFFDQTSYGTADGVFGVGFVVEYSKLPVNALVTYGDGSTELFALPGNDTETTPEYVGLTSDLQIYSLQVQGETSNIVIDNLTIGSGTAVPEASTWAMMILGLGFAGAALRRRSTGVSVTYA